MRTLVISILLSECVTALHVRGSFKPFEVPFAFLTKFGFQRTVSIADVDTRGYIFGNFTQTNSPLPDNTALTLSLLPEAYYGHFSDLASSLGRGSSLSGDETCEKAFEKVSTVAYDATCNPNGVEDFLRRVPCVDGKLCPDEDRPEFVIKGNQLTYLVEDFQHPRFWYLTIVSCYRDPVTCNWTLARVDASTEVKYDLWLVNGNPYKKHKNPLEYQFSFEKQDTVEMYLIFSAVYAVLSVVSWWNWYLVGRKVAHPAFVLSTSVGFLLVGLAIVSLDVCLFSVDGVGLPPLGGVARILRTFSQDLLVFLFIALASGWGLFYPDVITHRKVVIGTWLSYSVLSLTFAASKLGVEGEGESDSDAIQAWPDAMSLVVRAAMTGLFLRELRSAFSRPERPTLTHFPTPKQRETLLRFGAAGLVWFVGVPLALIIISTNVDAFWRFKIALGLTYGVDAVAHACLCHLLWAKRYTDNYGFSDASVVSVSPSPFLVDSSSVSKKVSSRNSTTETNGRVSHHSSFSNSMGKTSSVAGVFSNGGRRLFVDAGDGEFSDAELHRSLLDPRVDSDDDEDGVVLLNLTRTP